MSEPATQATKELLSWIPKKIRPAIAIIIILIILIVGFLIVKSKYLDKEKIEKCEQVTLKGSLLNKTKNEKLIGVKVELENSSTTVESYTTPDGNFLLEGIKIPKSNIISLLITYYNGKSFRLKDIDLNNTSKYSMTKYCVIDLQTVYVIPTVAESNAAAIPQVSTNIDNSQNLQQIKATSNEDLPNKKTPVQNLTGKVKISILPFEYISDDNTYSSLSKGVPESLVNSLSQIDKYVFIEGLQRDKVLKEVDFQQGKYVDIKSAVRIGRMLGAQQIIIGSCQVSNGHVQIMSRIVNVETGTIENSSVTQSIGLAANILEVQKEFAAKMFNNINNK